LHAGAQRHPRFRASEDGGDDPEATAFLHGISLFELERRLKVRAAANRARRLRDFCSGLHVLDGVALRGLSVSVDSDAYSSGARVSAILRSVLFTRVLQCATELPDPGRSHRGLARVCLYGQAILASVSTTPLQKSSHCLLCRPSGRQARGAPLIVLAPRVKSSRSLLLPGFELSARPLQRFAALGWIAAMNPDSGDQKVPGGAY
jgi:hypothetical protein